MNNNTATQGTDKPTAVNGEPTTANEAATNHAETPTVTTVSMKQRLKSWAVWASVLGALAVILNAFGVFEKIGIDSVTFDSVVNSIGSVLIAFGILNNPTDKARF